MMIPQTSAFPKLFRKRVLFLCLADANINLSGYRAEGVYIWTQNDYYRVFPDLEPDRIFEIHHPWNLEELQSQYRYQGDYRKVYSDSGAQIVTRYDQGFDDEIVFPLDYAVDKFGANFFVATTSFMFALAIMEGWKEIIIEGIHLDAGDQHDYMIPGMLRNIDAARAHGIEVIIAGGHESRWREEAKYIKEDWKEVYG